MLFANDSLPVPRVRFVDVASEHAGDARSLWLEADRGPEALAEAIDDFLAASPSAVPGGFAIRETEGFGALDIPPGLHLTVVSRLGQLLRRHGPVAALVVDHHLGGDFDRLAEVDQIIADRYLGGYPNLGAWGKQFASRLQLDCNRRLARYVDWTALARDAEGAGHFTTLTDASARVHVFRLADAGDAP